MRFLIGLSLIRLTGERAEYWSGWRRAWRRGVGNSGCYGWDEITEAQLARLDPEAWKARND